MQFIDLKKQYEKYKKEIDASILKVVKSGQFILGKEVSLLEKELSRFVGAKYAVGVASGTDGLMLSLMSKDIPKGSVVITTPFSFFATVEVIILLGLEPFFVDIDPKTFNMDIGLLEEVIYNLKKSGKKIKAIIPVSLYGLCADMDAINKIAQENQLVVIEDACQSFGASYKDRRSCNLSDIGVTSFFPSKPLGCYGDGGMIFTNNQDTYENIKMLRVHGSKKRYSHEKIGLNSRLDTIQAAILLEKFTFFEKEIELRQKVALRYIELLSPLKGHIEFQNIPPGYKSVYAQFTIRIKSKDRDKIASYLNSKGIPTAIHYPTPIPFQPALKGFNFKKDMFPNAQKAASEVLSLPMHPYLTEDEQIKVASALKDATLAL